MSSSPRVLYFDIETAPLMVRTWRWWQSDALELESDWFIICFGWRWEGDRTSKVMSIADHPDYGPGFEDDGDMVRKLWELFDEADVVVGHNGDKFDIRKVRARMLLHGLEPPSPFQTVDTLKIARKEFALTSNRLDALGGMLGLGGKADTGGWKLWSGCLQGDPMAHRKMARYCKRDVNLLRDVYLKLRPWASNHPNMANIAHRPDACPKCGSGRGMNRRGTKYTKTGQYARWQCKSCGGYCQSRMMMPDTERPNFT